MSHDCHGDEEEENVEKSPEEIQLEATIAKHVGFVQEVGGRAIFVGTQKVINVPFFTSCQTQSSLNRNS